MFCGKCGTQVTLGTKFCQSCGAPIATSEAQKRLQTTSPFTDEAQRNNSAGGMVARVIGGDMYNVVLGFNDGTSVTVSRNQIGFSVANGDMLDIYLHSDGTERYAPHDDMPRAAKNRVNKIVYILLAILLGDIGAHKFYCGKIGMGILYLAFCWTMIPGIAGLIEGILAIGKPTDAQGNMEIP